MLQCLAACQLPVKNADTPIFACKACACAGDNNVNHKGRSRGSSGNVAVGGNGGNGGNNNGNNANGGSGNSGDHSGNGGIARGNNGNGGNGGNAVGGELLTHFQQRRLCLNWTAAADAVAQQVALSLNPDAVHCHGLGVWERLRGHTSLCY